jgi:hypothetical protein
VVAFTNYIQNNILTRKHRGPEVETWLGAAPGTDPATDNDWSLLPFMALSDGAHASAEDYSYFTLRRAETSTDPATSLFGISCTRQLDASKLIDRPAEVTRSTVQKAVVVICDRPQHFGVIKAQLGVVVMAWFAQRYVATGRMDGGMVEYGDENKEQEGSSTKGIADVCIEILLILRYWSGSQKVCRNCSRTRKGNRTITLVSPFASSYMSSSGRLWFFSSVRYFSRK